ncbi:hypothetical protein EDD85DRAFT_954356 [Armillaria nabsnona]|nr:hypothetical protein EDD85DRAFT_954356 [Armillaria nabsnona]
MDWQYIQATILYADPTAADLWQRLSQSNLANQAIATWDAFKEECYGFYLKSNETRRYTPAHLEEAARILRASLISTLDEFGRFDRYIQNIGLDVMAGTSLLMSKHEPMARGFIPKPKPSGTFPSRRAFLPYTGVEQQAPVPTLPYAQPPAVAPLPPYRQQQMMMPGGSISDMIDQLSKATAAGLPLTYYNPYGFPSYLPQPQAAAPQAVQQQTIMQPAEATVKTESLMEERLLAAIQKLVNKGGANKRCRYDGCEVGYKECVAKKADMDKGLIKFDHIKRKLVMPDGSELPKGSGYLRPRVEKWHEEHRGASTLINMISTQHRYGMSAGVVYLQGFGPKTGNTSAFATVTPSQLMSLYEKHAKVQAAQLMACLEEQSDDEEEEDDPTIKVLEQILKERVKAKKDSRLPGKRPGKPFKKVEVVIPSTGANQPSAMVPTSTETPAKEPAPAPDTPAKAGTQPADAKKDHQ